jgi:hypothetical protein
MAVVGRAETRAIIARDTARSRDGVQVGLRQC